METAIWALGLRLWDLGFRVGVPRVCICIYGLNGLLEKHNGVSWRTTLFQGLG